MRRSAAVIGPGAAGEEVLQIAFEVGKLLAERSVTVICGGLGGVMEAACRGAQSAGGLTVGILPGCEAAAANSYVDIPLATGLGEARNAVLVSSATEGVIAVGGEYGTLSEIAFGLKIGKRVIGIGTWELSRASGPDNGIEVAKDADDAVRRLLGEIPR